MKSRGLTFEYEIVDTDSETLHVTGYSKHICITRAGHVATIPESWRQWGEQG
jgi:acyl-CoA thioesterase FadM